MIGFLLHCLCADSGSSRNLLPYKRAPGVGAATHGITNQIQEHMTKALLPASSAGLTRSNCGTARRFSGRLMLPMQCLSAEDTAETGCLIGFSVLCCILLREKSNAVPRRLSPSAIVGGNLLRRCIFCLVKPEVAPLDVPLRDEPTLSTFSQEEFQRVLSGVD